MPMTTETLHGQHVAVLAFPFGSHGLTILHLTLRLASASPHLHFSFLSTEKSNTHLFSTLRSAIPNNVKAYDVDDGFPSPPNHVGSLDAVNLFIKAAPGNLMKALEAAVFDAGRKVSCLLTDLFLTLFVEEMAAELNVPWIPLVVAMPYDFSVNCYTDRIRDYLMNSDSLKIPLEDRRLDFIPGLSLFRVRDLPGGILPKDSSEEWFLYQMFTKIKNVLPNAAAIVMNFCLELYSTPIREDLYSMFPNLLNLGFLTLKLPPPPLPSLDSDENGCLSWLDKQNPKSVVYISFGTMAKLSPEEVFGVAEALAETRIPFLWVLNENFRDFLPIGFLENSSSYGKMVSWAPQAQVLGHPSTEVFLTHAGANSVFESVANGVPMICRPFFGDHRMNGFIVEEVWGVGVRVEGMMLTKSGVVKRLELVLGDVEGKKMRERVEALRKVVWEAAGPDGCATKDFKTLVEIISKP